MILRLPHSQARHIAIKANPFMLRICILNLPRLNQSGRKVDLQNILRAIPQIVRDVNPMGYKHIIALQNRVAIEFDVCKSVETVERQYRLAALSFRGHRG